MVSTRVWLLVELEDFELRIYQSWKSASPGLQVEFYRYINFLPDSFAPFL